MKNLTKEQFEQIKQILASYPQGEGEEEINTESSENFPQPRLENKQTSGQLQMSEQKLEEKLQCPYCLIAENKIKAVKIFEDQNHIAVLEINPANPGHIILFPKKHIKDITSLTDQEAEHIFKIMKHLALSLSKISQGFNILISEGPSAGQHFSHLIINIIPRLENDNVQFSWLPKKTTESELNKIKEKLSVPIVKELKEEKPDFESIKKKIAKPEERRP